MTWYETAVQILLIGLANGSIIALIALGYTLVYGIIELINFAHGDVFMLGSMLALSLVQAFGLGDAGPAAVSFALLTRARPIGGGCRRGETDSARP